jgi:hypothetical protein
MTEGKKTDVFDGWDRHQHDLAVRMLLEQRHVSQPKPGARFDGAEIYSSTVRLSASRTEARAVRARPGTFEWRYGRKGSDAALYHAGNHLATLWERAGTAAARSPDLSMSTASGGWKGLPDGRASAMETLHRAIATFGQAPSARLTAYCVEGKTTSEIARAHGTTERNMAPVLHEDLRACATYFNFLGKTS